MTEIILMDEQEWNQNRDLEYGKKSKEKPTCYIPVEEELLFCWSFSTSSSFSVCKTSNS